jgi:hypothetical protein
MSMSRIVELYLHSLIRLHGIMLNYITSGITLRLLSVCFRTQRNFREAHEFVMKLLSNAQINRVFWKIRTTKFVGRLVQLLMVLASTVIPCFRFPRNLRIRCLLSNRIYVFRTGAFISTRGRVGHSV